jgi:hypothetical protein
MSPFVAQISPLSAAIARPLEYQYVRRLLAAVLIITLRSESRELFFWHLHLRKFTPFAGIFHLIDQGVLAWLLVGHRPNLKSQNSDSATLLFLPSPILISPNRC